MKLHNRLLATIAFAAGTLLATGAVAQEYPAKPVRLVDPYTPGGSTGVVARAIGAQFQEVTSQPMVIDNKPGAGSNIGSDIVAKAAPDGYTLLLGTSSLAINPSLYRSMPFDPIKDLAPIVVLIKTPNVVAVTPSLPVRSVKELIEYAHAHPGKLNYGSSGNGATNHMGMELFKSMANVDMVHVPFKGGGEALQALLGGSIQVMFNPASTLVPHDRSGGLRILAVGSSTRIEGLDYPTVAEAGLPGFESSVWFGLFAPAGTPPATVARINSVMNVVLKDKKVQEILGTAGLTPVGGTAEELKSLLASDTTRWSGVIRSADIKIQ
jgi:tripartite-type tricarboxylate transporter receptor subunit TctC